MKGRPAHEQRPSPAAAIPARGALQRGGARRKPAAVAEAHAARPSQRVIDERPQHIADARDQDEQDRRMAARNKQARQHGFRLGGQQRRRDEGGEEQRGVGGQSGQASTPAEGCAVLPRAGARGKGEDGGTSRCSIRSSPAPKFAERISTAPALALRAFGARQRFPAFAGTGRRSFSFADANRSHPPGAGGWRGWWLAPPLTLPTRRCRVGPPLSPAGRGMDSRIPFPRQRPGSRRGFRVSGL